MLVVRTVSSSSTSFDVRRADVDVLFRYHFAVLAAPAPAAGNASLQCREYSKYSTL